MAANIIIFDSQYIDEIIKNINRADGLVDEAINILKKAGSHRGWQCPEARDVSEDIDTISSRLKKFNRGLSATANALNRGKQNFQSLENRSDRQAKQLSDNLRDKYGFSASIRGKDEAINLPITEIPKSEDNFFVKIIKGTARNIIQGLGTVLGTAIGAIANCINGAGQGLITDIKDALITPMINIFQASYELVRPPYDDTAQSIIKIASNSASLLANAITFGKAGKLSSVTDKLIKTGKKISHGTTYANAANLSIMSAQNIVSGDSENLESNLNDIVGLVTNTACTLDQTILQGVKGAFDGAKDGATIGYNLTNMLCNILGL